MIKRPENFDPRSFEETFTEGMRRLGINIWSLEQWKRFGVEEENDILNYQFETDYNFEVDGKDPYAVSKIYEKIIDVKRGYNTKTDNDIKIGPMLLVNYNDARF